MPTLAQQRCFNHSLREAVARCPECKQYYCRECITEHDDRAICAACLKKLAHKPLLQRRGFAGGVRFLQCVAGIFLAWFFFYLVGQTLLSMPSSFHEGTLWQTHWFDQRPNKKSKTEIRGLKQNTNELNAEAPRFCRDTQRTVLSLRPLRSKTSAFRLQARIGFMPR